MEEIQRIQGRDISKKDIQQIQDLIDTNTGWGRTRISREIVHLWRWFTQNGQPKDMAARSLLRKLDQRGLIKLPPKKINTKQCSRAVIETTPLLPLIFTPEDITCKLFELTPLSLKLLKAGEDGYRIFSQYLKEYHYLGYSRTVGEHLAYLIQDKRGRDLGCLLFGAAAWKAEDRDRYIGWDSDMRSRRLCYITNNTRFLILPWVSVPHLASHVLGLVLRRLCGDWQVKYRHPIYLVETFVQKDKFHGTCYKASNWKHIGETKGRGRQDRYSRYAVPIKDIYVYPLTARFQEELCGVNS